MSRETAYRVFSKEFNASTETMKGDEEMSPTYIVSPLGSMINRVMIAGLLTEIDKTGTEEEPMWRGRVQDESGSFFFSVGRFQQEASASMAGLEAPCRVSIIGKVRTYTNNDGRTYVSVRPEHILEISEDDYKAWLLEGARSLWDRLLVMRNVLNIPDADENTLKSKGFSDQDAKGMIAALETYGQPDSSTYLGMIQNSLRFILGDQDIDFGIPGDAGAVEKPAEKAESDNAMNEAAEDLVMRCLEERDNEPNGVPIEDLVRLGKNEGIPSEIIEMATNSLMVKGLAYEPMLGFLKMI